MEGFREVGAFVAAANRTTDIEAPRSQLSEITGELGIDYFALVHHVDLAHPPPGAVGLSTYPASWTERLRQHRYYADDPVLAACQRAGAGFFWEDIDSFTTLSACHRRVLTESRHYGLGPGFTVPITIRGEPAGSSSFVVRAGRRFPAHAAAAMQSIGAFAFVAARRIARTGRTEPSGANLALTARQLDCLVLAARGKSDGVIAQLLGISRYTVNEHLERAKTRYAVASRTELVVRALSAGQLTYEDVFR